MKNIILRKNNGEDLDFNKMQATLEDLREFLAEDVRPGDEGWRKNFERILAFQAEDGSFGLIEPSNAPADARVEFYYTPTYICAAIMMKAFMADESLIGQAREHALKGALRASAGRKLRGHGYDAEAGCLDAMQIFIRGGVKKFLMLHPEICPEFTRIVEGIVDGCRERITKGDFIVGWNEDRKADISGIVEHFDTYRVFVYGTLLTGESNHDHYLKDEWLEGKAVISGYDMYDLGAYPGIVEGKGRVKGELYRVGKEVLKNLDRLEGEGSLYIRRSELVTKENGEAIAAFVYVYNNSIEGMEWIPEADQPYSAHSAHEDRVWYVAYGSNMEHQHLMRYIDDEPIAKENFQIPFNMYFRNSSGRWSGKGVSFLDVSCPGDARGVAYLIPKKDFEDLCCQENGGAAPEHSNGWYDTVVDLGLFKGIRAYTITNGQTGNYNRPSTRYLEVLADGLAENYPDMTAGEITGYLFRCERRN